MRGMRTTLAAFVLLGCFGPILRETISPPCSSFHLVPSPEPIPEPQPILVSEPTPDSEEIAVGNLASANEKESAPSWQFQRRCSLAEEIFWVVIGGLCWRFILLTISRVYDTYTRIRGWHGEGDTEQRLSQNGTELKAMLALEQKEKDHHHEQFLEEMDSIRKMMKEEKCISVEFQNEINSTKMLLKDQGHTMSRMAAAKGRHKLYAIKALQVAFEECKRRHPASKQFPVSVRAPMETYVVVSTSTAKKNERSRLL
jgi:hypothetical protein